MEVADGRVTMGEARNYTIWNRKSGAARAEISLLALCRVVTDFDNVKFSNQSNKRYNLTLF